MNAKIWTRNFTLTTVLLAIAIATEIIQYYYNDYTINRVSYWSLSIANLMALNYLYRTGSFSKSRWRNIQFLLLSLFITAFLFKIQHWPGASLLLTFAWGGAAALYSLWFASKEDKALTDVLKWIWVLIYCTCSWIKINHLFDLSWYGPLLSTGLLYVINVRVHVARALAPPEIDSEWDFDKAPEDSSTTN